MFFLFKIRPFGTSGHNDVNMRFTWNLFKADLLPVLPVKSVRRKFHRVFVYNVFNLVESMLPTASEIVKVRSSQKLEIILKKICKKPPHIIAIFRGGVFNMKNISSRQENIPCSWLSWEICLEFTRFCYWMTLNYDNICLKSYSLSCYEIVY